MTIVKYNFTIANMYRPRQIEAVFLEALASFPVVVLTGARQTGKTTLVRHLLAETHRSAPSSTRWVLEQGRA